MKCENCGNEVREGAKFCSKCGSNILEQQEDHSGKGKVIELTEKINEILIEVDPSLRGKLSVKKHRGILPIEMPTAQSK